MSDSSLQLLKKYRSKFYSSSIGKNTPSPSSPSSSKKYAFKSISNKNSNNKNKDTNKCYNYIEHLITIMFGFIRVEYDYNRKLPSIAECCILDYFPHKMSVEDFDIIRIIGKGGYGEVRVAKYKHNGEIYAMKTLTKKQMIAKKKLKNVKTERDLMVNVDHWLITRLFWSFQDSKYLYLVMEFCPGGDLMKILIKEDILSEGVTKFYMSECAVAIDYLHEVNYVHRDIKPDNILISRDGHIKLTDFGLSKRYATDIILSKTNDVITEYQNSLNNTSADGSGDGSPNTTSIEESHSNFLFTMKMFKNHKKKIQKNRELLFSAVGTPNYIAPEVFTKKGYGPECDFWSLGVITFECLVGYPPFYADTPINTVKRIVNFTKVLRIPKEANVSKNAKDFIFRLINIPQKRMNFKQIKKHSWMKRIPFKNLQSMQPPWIPKVKSDHDTRYFGRVQNAQDNLQLTVESDPSYRQSRASLLVAETAFKGFTFEREKPKPPAADSLFTQ